ncbi:MAG: DEAD/DEAH box helicase family protein [Chlamydiales bacterium]
MKFATRKKNIATIKQLIQNQSETPYRTLIHFLVSKGISPSIAEEVAREFVPKKQDFNHLEEILAKKIKAVEEFSFTSPKKLALVGPTGVGKTTTLLKLASFYTHRRNKKVTLITLDPRKEALMQLQSQWKIEPLTSYDLMLIDTEGCNYYQPNRVEKIGEELSNYEGVEVLLTLSASAKDVDLCGAIHQFSSLQPTGLIFTKLDETLTMGGLINVSTKNDLPIRYVTYGYPLPGEILIADPKNITHKILTDLNQKDFQLIRDLSIT